MGQNAHIQKDTHSSSPQVIAISSGKGGVGKSSITVNLAISLAKRGSRVCVLDADTGLANVNILLGLTPKFSLEHVLFAAKPIEEVMLDGPHGLKIVPGANGISECVTLHPRQQLRLTRELARIENNFDFLLVDTAAGIATTTLDFVSASHHALIVITPEPTSLTDAFSLIKLLKRRPGKIYYHVVVNMCAGSSEAKQVFHRFFSAVNKYVGVDLHYLGFVPLDESMRAAVTLQSPVAMFQDSDPSCQSFIRLAKNLEVSAKEIPSSDSFSSYWHRQFRNKYNGDKARGKSSSEEHKSDKKMQSGDVLEELKSQMMLVIEQGAADTNELESFFKDSIVAFNAKYDELPLDVTTLIDMLKETATFEDPLLKNIAEQVKPWFDQSFPLVEELMSNTGQNTASMNGRSISPTNDECRKIVTEVVLDRNGDQPTVSEKTEAKQVMKSADEDVSGKSPDYKVHQFDCTRFGSQEKLVQLLQRQNASDKSLDELLKIIL